MTDVGPVTYVWARMRAATYFAKPGWPTAVSFQGDEG